MGSKGAEVPGGPNVSLAQQEATQRAIAGGRQILGFEREEFAPFFGLQALLGEQIERGLVAPGEIPLGLSTEFQQRLRAGQAARGLETSPLGGLEEARALAGLSEEARRANIGFGQQFLSQFRPTTGFLEPIQPTTAFEAELQAQNQARQALFARRQAAQEQRAQFGGGLGLAA